MLSREEATRMVLDAKREKGLTFAELAKVLGRHPVWTAAAAHGQASLSAEEATKLTEALGLGPEAARVLEEPPMKGALDRTVPVDPLIYRFHEIVQVYGPAMKEVIHEEFGDGIMSAIDFEIDIERRADPKGDRVVVTFDGKFLAYRKW